MGKDKSLWGPILEKAFAKFHGNYAHTVSGDPKMAVRTLMSGPYEEIEHHDGEGNEVTDVETLWTLLKTHDTNHEIMLT